MWTRPVSVRPDGGTGATAACSSGRLSPAAEAADRRGFTLIGEPAFATIAR